MKPLIHDAVCRGRIVFHTGPEKPDGKSFWANVYGPRETSYCFYSRVVGLRYRSRAGAEIGAVGERPLYRIKVTPRAVDHG